MVDVEEIKTKADTRGRYDESELLKSLRHCKGITCNSMISFRLNSYYDIDACVKELTDITAQIKKDFDEYLIYCDSLDEKYDQQYLDYKYSYKAHSEAIDFIKGITYRDSDKDLFGLIVFYGHIDEKGESKKLFHTFPCPIAEDKSLDYKVGQRFNLEMLNHNAWFLEEFHPIN